MPDNIIPIQDLGSIGLIEDTPSVSLPPNAFSDVQNVRFHDGAVRKMPGESDLLSISFTDVVYFAAWPSPAGVKYVVVTNLNATTANISVYNENGTPFLVGRPIAGTMPTSPSARWQHTLFNGGFHIILNNGVTTPRFLQSDIASLVALPGWDSYAVQQTLLEYEFNGDATSTQTIINDQLQTGARLQVTIIPRNTSAAIISETVTLGAPGTGGAQGTITPDGTLTGIGTLDNYIAGQIRFTPNTNTGGATFKVVVLGPATSEVTAGVVRAYGNLLVAGNLVERAGATVLRTLTGTIRTSDVAGPGAIPTNWNPFNIGVNTADEFILASTGTIQDLVELQGVLYVYTDSSIHSIQQTGNQIIPFQISPVTNAYGALNTDSVLEVDGKHIVVGSNDVYVFAGHPGSISSIADARVRHQPFFERTDVRIVRFNKYDELWFWSPGSSLIYIWNYRSNTWTKRNNGVITHAGSGGSLGPVIGTATTISTVDNEVTYLPNSYIERRRFSMSPEFDTETIASLAIIADGTGSIDVTSAGSKFPGDLTVALASSGSFDVNNNYKQDIRTQGRFMNFRLAHATTGNVTISGIQLEIMQGGRR